MSDFYLRAMRRAPKDGTRIIVMMKNQGHDEDEKVYLLVWWEETVNHKGWRGFDSEEIPFLLNENEPAGWIHEPLEKGE